MNSASRNRIYMYCTCQQMLLNTTSSRKGFIVAYLIFSLATAEADQHGRLSTNQVHMTGA